MWEKYTEFYERLPEGKNLDKTKPSWKADAIKAEEANLKKRREHKTNVADHYAEYLKAYLVSTDRPRFESTRVQMSIRRSEAVEIDPLAHLPEEFLVEKIEVKPDKAKLKKAIKEGQTIDPGHESEHHDQVRPNRREKWET